MINPKDSLEKLFNPGSIPKLYKDKLHYIDLHIIDGCNFNCARCFKFSPLCKDKGIVNKDQTIKDLEQLATIEPSLKGISIIGGEPLISPDIIDYLYETRRISTHTDITIISNGLAIPKMPTEFFEALIKNNIMIAISKYFEDSFYSDIIQVLDKYNCGDRYVFSQIKELGCAMFLQMNLDEQGSQDIQSIWDKCSAKNGCVMLKDSKLWSCSNHCMKYILNNYFNTDLKDYPDDGISIYNNSYIDIINHLKKPKKGCCYCTEDIYNAMYFPEHTQYKKSEWIKE
jgi:hypothetical protein